MSQPEVPSDNSNQLNDPHNKNWTKGRRSIKLHQCLIPIESQQFERIRNLCFSQDILFTNLRTLLKNSPNLQFLSFQNPILVDYKKDYSDLIPLPLLKQLWFHNTRPLGKSEYWILEFLTSSVKLKNLKSFHFRMESSPTENFSCVVMPATPENKNVEKHGPEIDSSILTKFLIQNKSTLSDLALGGEGYKIQVTSKDAEQLKQIKLSSFLFAMNTSGTRPLLEHQKRLKHFTVKDAGSSEITPEQVSQLLDCIGKNAKFLQSLSIYNYTTGKNILKNSAFPFDGKLLKKCLNLLVLIVGIVVETEAQKIANTFTSIQLLPRSLIEISITCREFDQDEFDMLGSFIFEFKDLQKIYFCSVSTAPYSLKLDWIKGIKCLSDFRNGEFVNVKFDSKLVLCMQALLITETLVTPPIQLTATSDRVLKFVRSQLNNENYVENV